MQSLAQARSRVSKRPHKKPILIDQNREIVVSKSADRLNKNTVSSESGDSLGINAKYSAAPPASGKVDPETGEVLGGEYNPIIARFERFALQSAVRKLLPKSRTAKCLRLRQRGQEIQVLQSNEYKTCSYKGLQTCGSVWACPVCAAKISERRRVELKTAIALHQAKGGQVLLATYTNPHHLGDDLGEVLAGQARALSALNGDRA